MKAPRELVNVGELDRSSYLGGGDISALLGVNPWRTRLDVYLSKIGEETPQPIDPDRERRLLRGKRMEPYIVQMLAEDHGITITQRNARYRDPNFDFIAAEIDFEWHDGVDTRVRNGEIKTTKIMPGQFCPWGEEGTDEIPIYHAAQSMLGLAITGRETCQYGVLFGMDLLLLYQIQRDEDTIAQIYQVANEFWHQHVLPRVPPAPQTLGDIGKLWPRDNGRKIEATPEIEAMLEEHRRLGELKRVSEEQREELEFQLKNFCGPNAEIITKLGTTIATFKGQTRTSVDVKRLKLDNPAVYREYKREKPIRVLLHKKVSP